MMDCGWMRPLQQLPALGSCCVRQRARRLPLVTVASQAQRPREESPRLRLLQLRAAAAWEHSVRAGSRRGAPPSLFAAARALHRGGRATVAGVRRPAAAEAPLVPVDEGRLARVEAQLAALEAQLVAVEAEFAAVDKEIQETKGELREAKRNRDAGEVARLGQELRALRADKAQLRKKEARLGRKEEQLSSKEARLVQAKQERDTARTLRHEGQLRGPVRQQVREWVKTKLARKGVQGPPSDMCFSKGWAPMQFSSEDPQFCCFRPFVGPPLALPASLVSPVFGAFLDDAEAHTRGPSGKESALLEALLNFMPDSLDMEIQRQTQFNAALAEFLDCKVQVFSPDGGNVTTDGGITTTLPGGFEAVLLIVEVKNEMGAPSGDPYFQLQLEYHMYWNKLERAVAAVLAASPCPALLLEVVGPCLRVCAVASLSPGDVLCEPLTPFLHILHVRDQPRYMERLLATLRALRTAVAALRTHYEAADAAANTSAEGTEVLQARRKLPYPLRDDSSASRFVNAAELVSGRLLWVASERAGGEGGAPVCVKFSRHEYGEDVHAAWAAAGLAPALYECSLLPGGLRMVVMELLRKEDGWRMLYEVPPGAERAAAKAAALAALDAAHAVPLKNGGCGVHGDCRPANTLVRASPAAPGGWEVKFIDFDGAGAEGDKRYPPLMSRQLPWPPGAQPGLPLAQAHDRHFLANSEK